MWGSARRRMERAQRPRHYVSSPVLMAARPFFRYSYARGAYILRFVGENHGPVLREERRRHQREFTGPDRRQAFVGSGVIVGR